MNTKIIKEFEELYPKDASRMLSHELDIAEKKYMTEFENWNSNMILDFLINEKKFVKMPTIKCILLIYKKYYDFCIEKGLRKDNPTVSNLFDVEQIMQTIASNKELLHFYTRQEVIDRCNSQGNAPAHLSLVLSILDGVDVLDDLAEILYEDVDFENKVIHYQDKYENIILGDDTLQAYKDFQMLEKYKKGKNTWVFGTNPNYLIRRKYIIWKEDDADDDIGRKVLSRQLKLLGFEHNDLKTSGMLTRIVRKIGVEKFLTLMLSNDSREDVKENNLFLQKTLQSLGINISVPNFKYNYKLYALAIKKGTYQVIV